MRKDVIHIILISSDFYVPYTSVCINSILKNKGDNDIIHFHIVTEFIAECNKKMLTKMVTIFNCKVDFRIVTQDLIEYIEQCSTNRIGTIYNYKLCLSSLFEFDRALLLDADTIVLQNLSEIYSMDMEDCPIAGVCDPKSASYQEEKLDIPAKYRSFNNGVLLLNLKYWREHKVEKTFKELAYKYTDRMPLPDQDIFNIAFVRKAQYLPVQYNVFVSMSAHNTPQEKKEADKNPAIIHWADKQKPWSHIHIKYAHEFWKYARETPLYEVILERYFQEESERSHIAFLETEALRQQVLEITKRDFLYSEHLKHKVLDVAKKEFLASENLKERISITINQDITLAKLKQRYLKSKLLKLRVVYLFIHTNKIGQKIEMIKRELEKIIE